MTTTGNTNHTRMIPLWSGVLSLILGFPAMGLATGYAGDAHHPSGYSTSPHGARTYGHGQAHHGTSMSYGTGGSSLKSGHGPHQSASEFIEHILKFKEGMALTEEQVTKLQTIKTDFEKSKIKMKADMQLTSLDLHELLRNDQGDLGAVESKLKSLYEIRAGLYLASVKAGREAKAVLTDEQRSRMKAVHDRINAHQDGGMTKGHPGGYSHHSKDKQG
ncbi:Spy/CpxP family protein refolding chaperone [Nitrospira sp. T9]|uniref:Spy/CpxP family protein refolding chaperone n=1 Tax=unclassified Nitrospira TaxID=2652172 RepID=UPI003F986531